ncbi:hypothetical protein Asp14428_02890 [Actinoplanes sp. NBRC 14428]|nr:hypothetical protein Asp14428_02890 [Actinoplanes sp. NBRC 14428]
MIIQWCCKGLAKVSTRTVRTILDRPVGLVCQDWLGFARAGSPFPVGSAMRRLTETDLRQHVNDFSGPDPRTKKPFCETTPFISLSAGCVDRVVRRRTNRTYSARAVALDFATTDYADPAMPPCDGWILYCYVIVGSNPAVAVPAVAEEIRELHHARAFSGSCGRRWTSTGRRSRPGSVSTAPSPPSRTRRSTRTPSPSCSGTAVRTLWAAAPSSCSAPRGRACSQAWTIALFPASRG